MNTESFKLARATLRTAVKDYGFTRCEPRTVGLGAYERHYKAPLGKFQGEHWSVVHYYGTSLDGMEDEPLYDGDRIAADLFLVTAAEHAAFGFRLHTSFVALWYGNDGFVSLQQLTPAQYDSLRAQYDTQE